MSKTHLEGGPKTLGWRRNIEKLLNTESDGFDSVREISKALYEGIDTPVSLACYILLVNGEYRQLAEKQCRPQDYTSSHSYFSDSTAVSFLRKYPFPGFALPCADAAFRAFLECESKCAHTNTFVKQWLGSRACLPPRVEQIFFAARWKIHRLLGEFSVQEWLDSCRFGPGANLGVPGTSDYSKLGADPSVTVQLLPMATRLLSEYPGWIDSLTYGGSAAYSLKSIPGGRYSQVPKDAKTNRNIEVQPLLNGFTQAGIGSMIRRRLRSVGIDLDDQTRNQEAARRGSVDESVATLDLSNASDTIARELVRYLVPDDWYYAMDLIRTHSIEVNGEYRALERFCSMGNGFAFELESLIFWAISKSACESVASYDNILVYGDDIIVPSIASDVVASALQSAGFTVNSRKSFTQGPFRESCGSDWWHGRNVRPYFLKEVPTNVASLISLANGLKRVAGRLNRDLGYDRRLASAWYACLRRVQPAVRRRLAFGFTETDDVVLHGTQRDGYRVVFRTHLKEATKWYVAKAAALYRCDLRRQRASQIPIPMHSTGVITDYRRDCGDWTLRRHQFEVQTDATMIWW